MDLPLDRIQPADRLNGDRCLGEARDFGELHALLRARADQLNVSRLTIDDVAGFQTGYSGKLLAPVPIRAVLTKFSLGPMLGALGVKLLVIEDEEGMRKVRGRHTPRDKAKVTRR